MATRILVPLAAVIFGILGWAVGRMTGIPDTRRQLTDCGRELRVCAGNLEDIQLKVQDYLKASEAMQTNSAILVAEQNEIIAANVRLAAQLDTCLNTIPSSTITTQEYTDRYRAMAREVWLACKSNSDQASEVPRHLAEYVQVERERNREFMAFFLQARKAWGCLQVVQKLALEFPNQLTDGGRPVFDEELFRARPAP